MDNFKKLQGRALARAGYMLVPIKKGEKYPYKKGWPQLRATLQDVESWTASPYCGGLGVLGEFNPGIDIDVQDAEIVEKIVKWCREHIGVTPVRTGNAPRVLIPCTAPPGGLGPDSSAKFEDDLGVSHQIEIKAKGQQWVAYGIHPKTGKPYTWQGGELHEIDNDFLPMLTGAKITALFDYFESIAPSAWLKLSKGRSRPRIGGLTPDGELTGATAFENYKPPLNIDADRVRSILAALSPDGKINGVGWRAIGMAMYHQFDGSDKGKEIFREWSENSIEYDYDEIQARWPSWGAKSYSGNPVTFATVIQIYNEVTKKGEDPTRRKKSGKLSDWEKRYVMIGLADGTEVYDIGVPTYKARKHTLKAFREQNSGYLHRFTDMNGDIKTEPMVNAWQNSKNVRHFAGYTYQPKENRVCCRSDNYDNEPDYINTFFFPPHAEDIPDYAERLAPFNCFLKHLFPEKAERLWLIEWVARLIQNPDIRSFVTPINITTETGTGRGLFFGILQRLVGAHNCHDVSPDDIEGRFNGFLDKCLIAVVQEIKANTGSRKYQTWERMKSMLTDTAANIQAKGKDSYMGNVYANFLMFSNNIDALPLNSVKERRIYAMRGAYEEINAKKSDEIINWRDDKLNIASLFKYLKTYPVDRSHFKRAPVTATKIQMVNAAMGETEADLTGWLKEAPKVFDYTYASNSLEKYSEDVAERGLDRKLLGRILRDKGYHSARIRAENGRKYVYFHPKKTDNDPANLRELLNKI